MRWEVLRKAKMTERGLVVPSELLEGFDEVEIRREDHQIVIAPISGEDPIFQLGRSPVADDMDDASFNHDRYLSQG
jgi:virulence-associated protein VagC